MQPEERDWNRSRWKQWENHCLIRQGLQCTISDPTDSQHRDKAGSGVATPSRWQRFAKPNTQVDETFFSVLF
jgi:hypothetical protein